MDLPEIRDMGAPDDGVQKIVNKIVMENQDGDVENITITVAGFENPTAAAVAIMRFSADFVSLAMSGKLGLPTALAVMSEIKRGINGVPFDQFDPEGPYCEEHAEELADKLKPKDEDFDEFLRSLDD